MKRIDNGAVKHTAQAYLCVKAENKQGSAPCGSACGAGGGEPKPAPKPGSCGSACGAGDK